MNVAQHTIVNLLKTFFFGSSVFVSVCVFNVWPKTTLLLVWPRDAKRLDTPGTASWSLPVGESCQQSRDRNPSASDPGHPPVYASMSSLAIDLTFFNSIMVWDSYALGRNHTPHFGLWASQASGMQDHTAMWSRVAARWFRPTVGHCKCPELT